MLRIPSGAGAPSPPPPSTPWTEVWESEDAVYSGGLFASMTGRLLGKVLVPSTGYEPLEGVGSTLNGIPSVQFGTDRKRLELQDANLQPGSFTKWTVEIVRWQDNKDGVGDRQYDIYVANNSSSAPDHAVFPEQANLLGFNERGMFVGPDWFYVTGSRPTSFLEVATWTFDTDTVKTYSNGVQVGSTITGSAHSMAWANLYFGGSYGDYTLPAVQWAKGPRWSWRIALGTALDATDVLTQAQERFTRFGTTNFNRWDPTQRTMPLVGWFDQRGHRDQVGGIEWPGGTAPSTQTDDAATSGYYYTNTDPVTAPFEGSRLNGHPSLAFHDAHFFTPAGNTANGRTFGYTGAASNYELTWDFVMTPLGATTTQATAVDQRDIIIGDVSDWFALCLYMNSGVLSASVYWYASGTKTVSVPLSGAGVKGRLRLMYNGTTLSLQWNNGTPATVASGPLGNVGTILRFGKTPLGHYGNFDLAEWLAAPGVDATDNTNQDAYIAWKYGITL